MSNLDDMIVPDNWNMSQSIIKVIGVGGGGCNAVSEMYRQGIKDVEFMICNTDIQSLRTSSVPETLRLGNELTKGLGAGCSPERGRKAATESIEDIKKALNGNTEMVFITAGMGGGTGTGAAPIIAQVAKEMGKLTVAVVTLPFRDEGQEFIRRAVIGIKELQKHVDSLLIIDNQKLYQVFGELTIFEAFPRADEVLGTAVKSIAEIIVRPGFINVDFADVRMVMTDSGMAIMGMGEAEGPDRAIDAVKKAFESPLLNDCDLTTAKGVLVNITSSKEDGGLTMAELSQIMEYVNSYTGCAEKFKRGVVYDPNIGKKISVTIVATGFDMHNLPQINIDGDNDTVPLGDSGIYTSVSNTLSGKAIKINDETEDSEITSEDNTNNNSNSLTNIQYVKREGKPALILEEGDDINKLENIPAYKRRKINIPGLVSEIEDTAESMQHSSKMKIDQINGEQHLSDNSYIHKTQD